MDTKGDECSQVTSAVSKPPLHARERITRRTRASARLRSWPEFRVFSKPQGAPAARSRKTPQNCRPVGDPVRGWPLDFRETVDEKRLIVGVAGGPGAWRYWRTELLFVHTEASCRDLAPKRLVNPATMSSERGRLCNEAKVSWGHNTACVRILALPRHCCHGLQARLPVRMKTKSREQQI